MHLHCAAARALSLALVISASVTRRRPASSSSVEADYIPRFLTPPIPQLMFDARSISSRFPLRRKSGAHRLEIGPLLLTYLFSEGTYVSIHDVSPLMDPPPPSPPTPVLPSWIPEHIQ